MRYIYERRIRIPAPASQVFAWHEKPDALQKLIPPGDPVKLLEHSGDGIHDGARVVLQLGKGPFKLKWVALHDGYVKDRQFRDVQTSGPFHVWEHTHEFMPDGKSACILVDHVEYVPPFGSIGAALLDKMIRRKLDAMFDWRHHVTYKENALPR